MAVLSHNAMITFILHTHIPWVLRHGVWPHGSDWLCEAVAECYLPLISVCQRLLDDGIRPGITLDISPVLLEQLADPEFPKLFEAYCANHIALAEGDIEQFERDGAAAQLRATAKRWAVWYADRMSDFQRCGASIIGALRQLQDDGAISLMTCGATHGYLPLLAEDASVDLQVSLAKAVHQRHFGKAPKGIWLPECAYRPRYPWRTLLPVAPYAIARSRKGVEDVLAAHDLSAFVVDEGTFRGAHALAMRRNDGVRLQPSQADTVTRDMLDERSTFDVFLAGNSETHATVPVLARNISIAMQVWSGESGYPGHPDYLDFHKKFYRSSLRYWRVTDAKADMALKHEYIPEWAEQRALEHAQHYVDALRIALNHRRAQTGRSAVICLPFDTELFGHWWFEGPMFLEHVLRGIDSTPELTTATVEEAVATMAPTAVIGLPESSWGRNGTHEVWMHPTTQWMWEKEYSLEYRVRMLFEKRGTATVSAEQWRPMQAMMKQLLLAQSSDWPFLVSTGSAVDYASTRFHNHASDTLAMADIVEKAALGALSEEDKKAIDTVERRDPLFPEILDVLGVRPSGERT